MTITAIGCRYIGALVFLGPGDFIGTEGGGDEVPIKPDAQGDLTARYVIPATVPALYPKGGNVFHNVRVVPGTYAFGAYPAAICSVPFRVTRAQG